MRASLDTWVEGTVYVVLLIALIFIVWLGATAEAGSLKDAPGYHYVRSIEEHPGGVPQPARRSVAVPFPQPKPEGDRNAPSAQAMELHRVLLIRCASYYAIAQDAFKESSPEESEEFKRRGRAALAKSQKLPPHAHQSWTDESNETFFKVYEEYRRASIGQGDTLFDRYNEVCENLTDELVK